MTTTDNPYGHVTLSKTFAALPDYARTDIVEALIDGACVKAILSHIVTVCGNKAQHVRDNWQDGGLAKQWERLQRESRPLQT